MEGPLSQRILAQPLLQRLLKFEGPKKWCHVQSYTCPTLKADLSEKNSVNKTKILDKKYCEPFVSKCYTGDVQSSTGIISPTSGDLFAYIKHGTN